VRGKIPGLNTGFDVDEADLHEMQKCHGTVVASAIFGNCMFVLRYSNVYISESFYVGANFTSYANFLTICLYFLREL
jgi:hypothetical protein